MLFQFSAKLVNLTPQTINIYGFDSDEIIQSIPPSGTVARVPEYRYCQYSVNYIRICTVEYGEITGLPEPQEETLYIVLPEVLNAAKKQGRKDVIAPDIIGIGDISGGAVRDAYGRIIGTRNFLS